MRVDGDELINLRRWIVMLFELGADVPAIAKHVRRDRTTVRYHLRECGVFEKKGRMA